MIVAFIFIHVVIQLSFSYMFIISYLLSVVYLVIILCTLFICTSSSLYTHTLTRSLSDDPGFARPDIGRYVSIVQVSMRLYASRRAGASPYSIMVFLPLFIPVSILFLIHAY